MFALDRMRLEQPDREWVYDQPCLHEPTVYNSFVGEGCMQSIAEHLLQYNASILSGTVVMIFIQVSVQM